MKLVEKNPVFYKKVFKIALPIAAQSLITIGVNMLDTIMVGKLGDGALSAVSQANSFISIYQIFCMGLGMGASVLISRYWGMRHSEKESENTVLPVNDEGEKASVALKQTISIMLRFTFVLAALFAIATIFLPDKIMMTYTNVPEIVDMGVSYFRYSVITFFFLGLSLTTTIALRSVGQAVYPLIVSIGAFFINLCANYVFIFGKFGAPKMGVAGAALGTLLSRLFEVTAILVYLFFIDKRIGFKIKDLFMGVKSIKDEYVKICIPVLISDGILAIGNNSVAQIIGHVGQEMSDANAITSVTQTLSTVLISGVAQAGAIVTGHTLGMGEKEKTQRQGWLFLGLGLFLGSCSALFILLSGNPIISTYTSLSESTRQTAGYLMLSISIIVVFQATNSIMTKGVLRGGGDTKVLMLADNIFFWIIALPLGILAAFVFKLPAFWIYLCLKSDQIFKTFWCVLRLRSGKWIKKVSTGDDSNK